MHAKKYQSQEEIKLCEKDDRFLNIPFMIRCLQQTENEIPCFRTGIQHCNRRDCKWRIHCQIDQ